MTFGERIRQLREERGWSQRQLADRVGRKRGSITMLELHTISNPKHDTVCRYAEVFGLAPEELLAPVNGLVDNRARRRPGRPRSKALTGERRCTTCGWHGSTPLIFCPVCGSDWDASF